MKEIWKKIPNFCYAVSTKGRVKALQRKVRFLSKRGNEFFRLKRERLITLNKQNGGYLIAHLYVNDKRTARTVHSLVAEAFIGKRPKGFDICHFDGNRTNNKLKNLRYDTRSGNFQDMKRHGTYWIARVGNQKWKTKQ